MQWIPTLVSVASHPEMLVTQGSLPCVAFEQARTTNSDEHLRHNKAWVVRNFTPWRALRRHETIRVGFGIRPDSNNEGVARTELPQVVSDKAEALVVAVGQSSRYGVVRQLVGIRCARLGTWSHHPVQMRSSPAWPFSPRGPCV